LIYKTSIRRFIGEAETARAEVGDVIEYVRWEDGVLHVRDTAGKSLALGIDGDRRIV
jgi:hypothetical protein